MGSSEFLVLSTVIIQVDSSIRRYRARFCNNTLFSSSKLTHCQSFSRRLSLFDAQDFCDGL
jgi:hypothetical protein